MKLANFIIILILFLLRSLNVFSQGKDKTFKAYIVAGFNTSQIDGDDMSGFKKFGGNGGAGVYFKFKKHWSVSTEVLYSMRGSNGSPYLNGFRVAYPSTLKIVMDYVEIPLIFSFHDRRFAMFGLGCSMGGLARYQYIEEGKDMSDLPKFAGLYKSIDFSGLANITFFIKNHFGFNLRWSYSILPITKNTLDPQHHNCVTVRAMYLF